MALDSFYEDLGRQLLFSGYRIEYAGALGKGWRDFSGWQLPRKSHSWRIGRIKMASPEQRKLTGLYELFEPVGEIELSGNQNDQDVIVSVRGTRLPLLIHGDANVKNELIGILEKIFPK